MAHDFKTAHVLWTTAMGGDARRAESALRSNATSLRNMAGRMLRSKHTPRLEFVNDHVKSKQEMELDEAFARAEEDKLRLEEHLERLAVGKRWGGGHGTRPHTTFTRHSHDIHMATRCGRSATRPRERGMGARCGVVCFIQPSTPAPTPRGVKKNLEPLMTVVTR